MKIVLATNNLGKLNEFQTFFGKEVTLIPQKKLNISDALETGTTFIENAIIKAKHAAKVSGLPALADDSGLCVDILKGEPGVYSARFAGPKATDKENIEKLLFKLKKFTNAKRVARFHCTLVLFRTANDPIPIIAEGEWEGLIKDKPIGENGFGYDPVFFIPTLNKTAAMLSLHEKNQLSHRANALRKLLTLLQYK